MNIVSFNMAERENRPELSVIIVNYNSADYLDACLESLRQDQGVIFETVVVDNASPEPFRQVTDKFPEVRVIESEKNVGFAGANNKVIEETDTPFVLLLNPDTEVTEEALGSLVNFLKENQNVGVVGPKLVHNDGSVDWRCRRGLPTPQNMLAKALGLKKLFPDDPRFSQYSLSHLDPNETAEVGAVSGACMMVRREAIEQAGLLDEGYFMMIEDVDWMYRIGQTVNPETGETWDIFYFPEVEVVHHGGKSRAKAPFKSSLDLYRSMRRFNNKHFLPEHNLLMRIMLEAGLLVYWGISASKVIKYHLKNK